MVLLFIDGTVLQKYISNIFRHIKLFSCLEYLTELSSYSPSYVCLPLANNLQLSACHKQHFTQ